MEYVACWCFQNVTFTISVHDTVIVKDKVCKFAFLADNPVVKVCRGLRGLELICDVERQNNLYEQICACGVCADFIVLTELYFNL